MGGGHSYCARLMKSYIENVRFFGVESHDFLKQCFLFYMFNQFNLVVVLAPDQLC